MPTAIANGRVNQSSLTQASRVLASYGMTVSEAIRNFIDHIAQSGEVPSCARVHASPDRAAATRELSSFLESIPMPGRVDGMTDEDILASEREARYGA